MELTGLEYNYMSYSYPHLTILDTTTQTIASAGTPQIVTFNTTGIADKIAVTSSSRFTVNEAGQYLLTITAYVTDTSAANKTLDMWARVNGTDVANSNTKTFITSTGDSLVASIARAVTMTAGQYIEIWINGDSTTLSLLSSAAGTTPTRPATPSIFLTFIKIHP